MGDDAHGIWQCASKEREFAEIIGTRIRVKVRVQMIWGSEWKMGLRIVETMPMPVRV